MQNEDFRRKVHACWLGKAIGGTLGTPHEGKMAMLDLDFYDPVPCGILPNDDLDLQLVWLHHLRTRKATQVTPELLGAAWRAHVKFPFDEYAVCLRNQELGLTGCAVGGFDNWFGECMGAAIRSEIWACVAPGEPGRAAGFAWADAVCDHCGEGVWAEVFFAALQSAAFVENNPDRLLDTAESFLPEESLVRQVSSETRRWWTLHKDIATVRDHLIARFGTENFTDVKVNIGFTLLGWLAGEGDFGRAICIATNCGYDTDCTAATLGALLGIQDPACIPAAWAEPIGTEIVYSAPIVDIIAPRTLEELTTWTLELRDQLAADRPALRIVPPRRMARSEDAVMHVPLQIAEASPSGAETPSDFENLRWETREVPGHWIALPHTGQTGTFLRWAFEIPASMDLLVMAFSRESTRVWMDGVKLSCVPSDPTCLTSPAPSFHRGGKSIFAAPALTGGRHELVIHVDAAHGGDRELVFGLGETASRLWLSNPWINPSLSPGGSGRRKELEAVF